MKREELKDTIYSILFRQIDNVSEDELREATNEIAELWPLPPAEGAELDHSLDHSLDHLEGAEEFLKQNHISGADFVYTTGFKNMVALVEKFATLHAQRIAEKMVSERLREMTKRCKKLEFMIDNGLGWDDMRNDITMPHEL